MKWPWASIIGRGLAYGALGALLVLTVDGCLYRDPGVDLAGGYSIAAISAGSPCDLYYRGTGDKRVYSDWVVLGMGAVSDGKISRVEYSLENPKSHEHRDYPTREEWLQACQDLNVSPSELRLKVSGVTGFAADAHHIIGQYEGGYFLLDIDKNRLETWQGDATWSAAVTGKTRLNPAGLTDPKGWWVRTRDPGLMEGYAAFVAVFLMIGAWSGWPKSCRAVAGDAVSQQESP